MDAHPWVRQQGEDAVWFARFERYRLMGRKRSIEQVYAEEPATAKRGKAKRPNERWYLVAAEWDWKERATAWDVHRINEDAEKQAEYRRQMLAGAFSILAQKLPTLQAQAFSPRVFAEVMKIVFTEQRVEYGQTPAVDLNITLSFRQTVEQIAKARGVDPDDLERQAVALMNELGIGGA